jgi:sugar phosphate isomerase/epimerase
VTFKYGYSTYALKMVDPFEAVQKIKDTGYDALEICVRDGYPTAPSVFGIDKQRKLAALSQKLGFPSPILFGAINVCAPEAEREAMMADAVSKFRLARELHYDDTPILVTTTAGHIAGSWEEVRGEIRDGFLRLADVAEEHDVIIAIEAHAGTVFELPEKAAWVMQQTQHPNLKLDLDVSHFYVEGADVVESVNLCAADSVMVHIKDGEKVDGVHRFSLTGAGNIDIEAFMRALKSNKIDHMPIFVEVSVHQSEAPDYDPWGAAKFSYDALVKADKAIG